MSYIDIHSHAISPTLLAEFARTRSFGFEDIGAGEYAVSPYGPIDQDLYRHEKRLQGLADRDVAIQLISPIPFLLSWPGGAADCDLARRVNASTAECVASSGGRFRGLAALPLAQPEAIVGELDRCLGEHGFPGVALTTHGGRWTLDDPVFAPLWAELERRRLLIFMHPTNVEPPGRWADYMLNIVLAWPNETTLAVSRLIFAGVFERHPDLNLILAHGGGNLAFMKARLDLAYHAPHFERNPDCSAHIRQPPSAYLSRMFFDSAVGGRDELRFLVESVGPERVVFGSDEPYEIADRDGAMARPFIQSLEPGQAEMIGSATLRSLLSQAGCDV